MTDDPLYRLLAWSSPAYPIGAYSYSHGIEWAVESGLLRDRAEVVAWLQGVLADGAGKVDGAFFAAAWRAASERDDERLDEPGKAFEAEFDLLVTSLHRRLLDRLPRERAPEVRAKFLQLNSFPVGNTPDEFAAQITSRLFPLGYVKTTWISRLQ